MHQFSKVRLRKILVSSLAWCIINYQNPTKFSSLIEKCGLILGWAALKKDFSRSVFQESKKSCGCLAMSLSIVVRLFWLDCGCSFSVMFGEVIVMDSFNHGVFYSNLDRWLKSLMQYTDFQMWAFSFQQCYSCFG